MDAAGCVLVLGGANLDVSAGTDRPLRPGDSTPGTVRFTPGGVARNVAENLARLGHAVRLISAVGDDAQGHALLAATRQAGVDVEACCVLPDQTTACYVAVHGDGGDMALAVNDMQVLDQVTPARLQPHADALCRAAAVVVDCNLTDAALSWVFAHVGDTPVFVDAVSAGKCRRILPWLQQVHTLKANRLEAQALSGLPAQTPQEVESVARDLIQRGVHHVVVSLGADGLHHRARDTLSDGASRDSPACASGWQRALPVDVHNTTGAGDALMAGLVHSHLRGRTLAQAARFANGCAALTLSAASANHPGLCVASVEALLQERAPS